MMNEAAMKALIIGANGQLGRDMLDTFQNAGIAVIGIDMPDIDITNRHNVSQIVHDIAPTLVVNCAAYTAVDACEQHAEEAYAINAEGIANIAYAARRYNAAICHFSTDYVFDGAGGKPYSEEDRPNPKTVYGKSKLEGERALAALVPNHYIIRIAWLYGVHGMNFVKTMIRLGREKQQSKEVLKVVADQIGSPTWTVDVCRQCLAIIGRGEYGLYHCTSQGQCSWHEFTEMIMEKNGIEVTVAPCATSEFPRPAPRPMYSVLENKHLASLGIDQMPDWRDAFGAFMKQFKRI